MTSSKDWPRRRKDADLQYHRGQAALQWVGRAFQLKHLLQESTWKAGSRPKGWYPRRGVGALAPGTPHSPGKAHQKRYRVRINPDLYKHHSPHRWLTLMSR